MSNYSVETANVKVSQFLNRKGLANMTDTNSNWNSMFTLLTIIGHDNEWDVPKTMHIMHKKHNPEGVSGNIEDLHKGVFTYLLQYKPGEMTSAQILSNNTAITDYLGLSFKKGGKNDEFMGITIKSTQSLKFHEDWNWLMGVIDVIEETHPVVFTAGTCDILDSEGEGISTALEEGESKLMMVYRAVVGHSRDYRMEAPTDINCSEGSEESEESEDVSSSTVAKVKMETDEDVSIETLDVPYGDAVNETPNGIEEKKEVMEEGNNDDDIDDIIEDDIIEDDTSDDDTSDDILTGVAQVVEDDDLEDFFEEA